MPDGRSKELIARRALEDQGYVVHDANVLFRQNCPNIDLVVFGNTGAQYLQVKSSSKPATKDFVTVDGSPWTEAQLYQGAPIFNRHPATWQARLVMILEFRRDGEQNIYLVPPDKLTRLALKRGREYMQRPKRDGKQRRPVRKEIPRIALKAFRNAWNLLEV